jgi:MFS family permease
MFARNLIILFVCQLISATGAITMVTLGGIIGSGLTENQAIATLPISIMVLSTAATTIPATILMRRIGRKYGFMLSSLSAAIAAGIATMALHQSSFALFILAGATFGINMAFTQQYRYAAAESVEKRFTGRAISMVLAGAIGGALIGPELILRGQNLLDGVPYGGTLLCLSVLYVAQAFLLSALGPLKSETDADDGPVQRPMGTIVRQPVFLVAVIGGTCAYGVMTLIMTATPMSMHINHGFGIDETTQVIRSHVLAMYVPSLVSGYLMDKLGTVRMMTVGVLALIGACIVGLQGQSLLHYWWALVLMGVGWNFLYVGGTTMVTLTYTVRERFRAQAVNEFSVFGVSAIASLLAGTVIHYYGWNALVTLPILPLVLTLVGLYLVRGDALLQRLAPRGT